MTICNHIKVREISFHILTKKLSHLRFLSLSFSIYKRSSFVMRSLIYIYKKHFCCEEFEKYQTNLIFYQVKHWIPYYYMKIIYDKRIWRSEIWILRMDFQYKNVWLKWMKYLYKQYFHIFFMNDLCINNVKSN